MSRVGRNIGFSVGTTAVQAGVALVSVPLILDAVGTAGYGVWALAQAVVLYAQTAQAGLGAGVQRLSAVLHGAGDRHGVARALWTALLIYALLGALAVGLALLLAEPLVELFNIEPALQDDAVTTFELVGPILALAFIGAAINGVLTGLQRFAASAATAMLGAVTYAVALAILLHDGRGIPGVAEATLWGNAVIVASRLWIVRAAMAGRPRIMSRSETRTFASFSAKLQMTALAALVNHQTDRVVVGLVGSTTAVGQVSIAGQLADLVRLTSASALTPLQSSIAFDAGARSSTLLARVRTLDRLWTIGIVGLIAVGVAGAYPAVRAWLGPGHEESAVLGAILILAYGCGQFAQIGAAYLRAEGRPELETRYALISIVVNLALTVPLGLALEALGVVLATLVGYVTAAAWFLFQLNRHGMWLVPRVRPAARIAALAAAAAAAAGLGGLAVDEALPAPLALVPVLVVLGLAFVAYVSVATGIRPTPAGLRAAGLLAPAGATSDAEPATPVG